MNIPVHFVKETKGDKMQFELFAVAVMFKMNHVNSIAGKYDNKTLRKVLHCKHNVAQRILDGMPTSRFFKVNRKSGIVFVPTFKSSVVRTFGRRKKSYDGTDDYCKKLEVKDYTLREMKNALRELLIENFVHIRQTQQVKRLGNLCVTDASGGAITLEQFSRCFGLSRSSAWRYVNRLVTDGRVSKTQTVAECVIPELNDITEREFIEKNPNKRFHAWHNTRSGGWSGWANKGCIYEISDRSVSESFKHIIWNHEIRLRTKYAKGGTSETPDGEGFWAKHS